MRYVQSEFESKSLKRVFVMVSSVLALTFAVPYVATAYSVELVKAPVLVPESTTLLNPMSSVIVRSHHVKAPNVVAGSPGMIGAMLSDASNTRTRLLWSMYPAAVRGRIFGANGGDPTIGGGW